MVTGLGVVRGSVPWRLGLWLAIHQKHHGAAKPHPKMLHGGCVRDPNPSSALPGVEGSSGCGWGLGKEELCSTPTAENGFGEVAGGRTV